jgi:predicted NACHT family NTPase
MVQQILGLRNGRDIEAVRKDADKMYHAILQFSPKCKQAKLDALEQRLKADANVPHVPQ